VRSARPESYCESMASRSWDNVCRKRAERYASKTRLVQQGCKDRSFEQKLAARHGRNQIVLVLVLVLVLDSKRISRSAACTSGNFETGTAFHFRQPSQPFEHEHEHEKILAKCVDLLGQ
jgi:hypothetical protein